jgi:2-amino-4-hydroxy-6-hydroxymethyldihydropteridine diphosphokinase
VSSFYDTAPIGYLDQPRFLNGALLLETSLEPLELMTALLEIERSMGRVREGVVAKGPRVIDLDLLLYGNRIIESERLTLPHPAMHERAFVLEPLAEIAGEMVHPVLKFSVRELLKKLS